MNKILLLVVATLFSVGLKSFSQTLPVGLIGGIEDNMRRQQLLGNDSSKRSFMLRPLFLSEGDNLKVYDPNNGYSIDVYNRLILKSGNGKASLYALPVVWKQQFNTHHPYGWNDGSMIPAKGYQTQLSGGIYGKFGALQIQLRPEFVHAYNANFTKLSEVDNGSDFATSYKGFLGAIEQPERFGDGRYNKVNWGQSSIRINVNPVSFGLSNENLWWGPGIRSSLLMSNNAPGFKHLTLNTIRPVNTPIGSFESQLIAGRLEGAGVSQTASLNIPEKSKDWRYLSGFMITYQPKWLPGLFFGLDRTYTTYNEELGNSLSDYFPVFAGTSKKNYINKKGEIDENSKSRDQRLSVFIRWIMAESHSEIYFQFAKNDQNYNQRTPSVEPEQQYAYLAGFRKLVPLAAEKEYIQVGLELVQLEANANRTSRGGGNFYGHGQITEGYTHQGQIIGAGIGSGGNLQSLDVSWVKGLKKIGLQFERMTNNNTLFYNFTTDYRRHWTDLSVAGKLDWDYKKITLSSQMTYIRSFNYQYRFLPPTGFWWDWPKQDVNNVNLSVGLMYRW